ncbi:BglG family transcription antiterminator [Metabacillus hrfriensis]|uniref:PRD domain-containing protein n=1 Tax=Metabacillus hrfriensis TaxID=3048891 RepID=A0ACD4RC59_9BACI|nr:PRD domain-containing protein [Metabacillus sp. CT-WN-B3]WHZ58034.1 PRD domain-containing protein [Metabacillus sp. CT-WN-B3]
MKVYITARERDILKQLFEQPGFITVHTLANDVGVSSRTIHREMKKLEDTLKNYRIVIEKKAGQGVKLTGLKEDIDRLRNDLSSQSSYDYLQDERVYLLISELIQSKEQMKLYALASKLLVSAATISHDLDRVEKKIEPYELELVRKRGFGVQLTGEETAKRRLLEALLLETIDEQEFIQIIDKDPIREPESQTYLGFLTSCDLNKADDALKPILEMMPYEMADNAYFSLLIHLSVAVKRLMQQKPVSFVKSDVQNVLQSEEFQMAARIGKQLTNVFSLSLPEEEITQIAVHLRRARRQNEDFNFEQRNSLISLHVKQLIEYVADELDAPLRNNQSLYNGLISHLEPAYYRMKDGIYTHNPFAKETKENYPKLYEAVKKGLELVFPSLVFPDDETAFVVLHFGSSLEERRQVFSYKALIVCSSGIGSSKMLATRIHKEIPEITETALSSLIGLKKLNLENFDLIISTVSLPLDSSDYIQVGPLLADHEAEKIREQLKSTSKSKKMTRHPSYAEALGEVNLLEKIEVFEEAAKTVKELLRHFRVYHFSNHGNHRDVLFSAAEVLKEQGLIRDSETLTSELLKREELGGLGIPDSSIALYHCRDTCNIKPVFVLFNLEHPYTVPGMDNREIEMKTLALLLAPEDFSHTGLEVLSLISATLIETEDNLQLFQSGNGTKMTAVLNETFHKWLTQKFIK